MLVSIVNTVVLTASTILVSLVVWEVIAQQEEVPLTRAPRCEVISSDFSRRSAEPFFAPGTVIGARFFVEGSNTSILGPH